MAYPYTSAAAFRRPRQGMMTAQPVGPMGTPPIPRSNTAQPGPTQGAIQPAPSGDQILATQQFGPEVVPAVPGEVTTTAAPVLPGDNGGRGPWGAPHQRGRGGEQEQEQLGPRNPYAAHMQGLLGRFFENQQGPLPALPAGYPAYPEGQDFGDWRAWTQNVRQTMPNWQEDFRTAFGSARPPWLPERGGIFERGEYPVGGNGEDRGMAPAPQPIAVGEPAPAAGSELYDPATGLPNAGLLGLQFPRRRG